MTQAIIIGRTVTTTMPAFGTELHHRSAIRFLVSRSGTRATKLLWLAPPIIRDQQCPIVLDKSLLELILRVFIHIFLIVRNY